MPRLKPKRAPMHKLMNLVAIIGLIGMIAHAASSLMPQHASSSYASMESQR